MTQTTPSLFEWRTTFAAVLLGIAAATVSVHEAHAESRWSVYNPQNTQTPDYAPLDVFFGAYADTKRAQTTFAYQAMGSRGAKFLNDYVSYLQSIPVSQLNRDQQLAFWLNLHNAAAMRETLGAYPTRRVEALVTGTGSAWSRKTLIVEGVPLSLAEIETDILLTEWQDPRVIYGIYLPAKAAPALPTRAFKADSVYKKLEEAAGRYVNGRYAVTKTGNNPTVSLVYQRFKRAFGDDETTMISHLQSYAKSRLARRIADAQSIGGYEFDWALNEHKPRQPSRSLGAGGVGSRGGGFGS